MDSNLLTLIGVGLATMFFGYFFGLFEGRGQGRKQHAREVADLKPETPPSAPQPAPPSTPTPPAKPSLLRLSLDDARTLRLELDDRPVDVNNLSLDQRKRLIDLMVTMRPWIEGTPASKPVVPPSPASSPVPAPVSTSVPLSSPGLTPTATPTVRPPADPAAPTTMVGQIDAILQARLLGTPLGSRGIRLSESIEGGATIHVGAQTYSGVGDVPDKDVQDAIRAAIADWEKKYTPS